MSTLFYPVITFVLLLVCVSYWGITALYPLTCFRSSVLCTVVCVVCSLTQRVHRYLATSGGPVYKVVALNASQGDCSTIRANETCDPEVKNTHTHLSRTLSTFFMSYFLLMYHNNVRFFLSRRLTALSTRRARLPAVSSLTITLKGSSRRISLTCSSITPWLSSGV